MRDKLRLTSSVGHVLCYNNRWPCLFGPRQGDCKNSRDSNMNIHMCLNKKSTTYVCHQSAVCMHGVFLCANILSSTGFFVRHSFPGSQIWRRPATGDGLVLRSGHSDMATRHEAILKIQLQRPHRLSHSESNYKVLEIMARYLFCI